MIILFQMIEVIKQTTECKPKKEIRIWRYYDSIFVEALLVDKIEKEKTIKDSHTNIQTFLNDAVNESAPLSIQSD